MENINNKIDAFTTLMPLKLFDFNAENDFWVGKQLVSNNSIDASITDIIKGDDAMLVKISHGCDKRKIAVNLAIISTWNYPSK